MGTTFYNLQKVSILTKMVNQYHFRGNLGSPRYHTLISPRDCTLTSPRLVVSFQHTLASPRLLNSLSLPNLTKANLRSRAPNPAGASTHPS